MPGWIESWLRDIGGVDVGWSGGDVAQWTSLRDARAGRNGFCVADQQSCHVCERPAKKRASAGHEGTSGCLDGWKVGHDRLCNLLETHLELLKACMLQDLSPKKLVSLLLSKCQPSWPMSIFSGWDVGWTTCGASTQLRPLPRHLPEGFTTFKLAIYGFFVSRKMISATTTAKFATLAPWAQLGKRQGTPLKPAVPWSGAARLMQGTPLKPAVSWSGAARLGRSMAVVNPTPGPGEPQTPDLPFPDLPPVKEDDLPGISPPSVTPMPEPDNPLPDLPNNHPKREDQPDTPGTPPPEVQPIPEVPERPLEIPPEMPVPGGPQEMPPQPPMEVPTPSAPPEFQPPTY